jgi:hypothetical protein
VDLKPLYLVRFRYPDGWQVDLEGERGIEEHHFYFAEGRCEGTITGSFRAANHPRRRTDVAARMDLQGFIETDDGALIMLDYQGYGRAYPQGRRQVVGAAFHITSHERYKHLNDSVCVISGEVRTPAKEHIEQGDVELVFQVSELIWSAPPD